MSIQGIRSNRGDTYQRSVALYWVVKMLLNDDISGVQVDVISTPGIDEHVFGDDIVVLFKDGKKDFIQAKVNQKNHNYWRLSDAVLIKELIAAKHQLLASKFSQFSFYSRTPFNVLQRLSEELNLYPDWTVFNRESSKNVKEAFTEIQEIWELDQLKSFALIKRISIGDHHSSSEWEYYCLQLVQSTFSKPKTALELIINYIDRQHSKLGTPVHVIDRSNVIDMLEQHGIYSALKFNEKTLVEQFKTFSLQGRQWVRTVGGDTFVRQELEQLKKAVNENTSSVLLEDVAGGGKTCILLNLIDYLEEKNDVVSLFIRGDLFASIESLSDLSNYGLAPDLLNQTARLADNRKVVVIIDSLDVLAVGRSHKSLQIFLALISGLSKVPNITIIAASRSFDARYDPLLREFSWSETISIHPPSFDGDITPLLLKRSINPNDVSDQLKKLLLIPQTLRLFCELIDKGATLADIEAHDLYAFYIHEIVDKDPCLGKEVVNELQKIAVNLLKERSYEFPKASINLSSDQIKRLLSQQVLAESSLHQVMFSHQTIADALRIQNSMQSKITLQHFVTTQPQLPFIRPSVRTFITALRKTQPQQFTKQIRHLLLDESISMHLKRLAVESLGEMGVRDSDLAIISILSNKLPNLFSRFLNTADSQEWFTFLHDKWLPTLSDLELKNNAGNIFRYFSRFLDGHEELIIKLWLKAINEEWLNPKTLIWQISAELERIKAWDTQGVVELIEKLLSVYDGDRDNIGKLICHYIEVTGEGDELLWRFITRDIDLDRDIKRGKDLKFNCQKHDLLNEHYLESRLKSSSAFFSCVMKFLLQFSTIERPKEDRWLFDDILLKNSSYNRRHSTGSMHAHDSINELLKAVESAMKYRAENNDSCWKKFEPLLRNTSDVGLRYILCQSYLSNVKDNIRGISYQLTDRELIRYHRLAYELGVLANKAYPYLSYETHENHQMLSINLYSEIDDEKGWREKSIYESLVWVPCIYRLPEVSDFIEICVKKYGNILPSPSIQSSWGWVKSPVSSEQLTELNDSYLLKLFQHYNDYNDWHESGSDGLTGNRESLEQALRTAASWQPMHFISLTVEIERLGLKRSYINNIIEGVATHLRCRFGNLNDSGWKENEPLPDGKIVAQSLMNLIDRFCISDKEGRTYSIAIEGCAVTLTDDSLVNRLAFHFWQLSTYSDPLPEKDDEERDLIEIGINSVRGTAIDSLMALCINRIEHNLSISVELEQLLMRYAKDPSMVVRATLLRRLPFFHYLNAELGWKLLKELANKCSSELSKYLEETLYYQYDSNFQDIKPYLELIKSFDNADSDEVWGRLSTLSYLSDHISENELWIGISDSHENVKNGVGQVFVSNLSNPKTTTACVNGLSLLMDSGGPSAVYRKFVHSLSYKADLRCIPLSLVHNFINTTPVDHLRDIDGIFDWSEYHVLSSPEDVLDVLEIVVNRLSKLAETEHIYFYRADSLITTLKCLLQEADLSDNNYFIDQVLSLQYWFLDHGADELEELFDAG